MTDYNIPCDTVARLGRLALSNGPDGGKLTSLRLDNGQVIATNKKLMVVENIGGFTGVVHVAVTLGLIEQCEEEAKYNSVIRFIATEPLGIMTAKTSYGWSPVGNLWVPVGPHDFDKWRTIVMRASAPLIQPGTVGMYWNVAELILLGQTAPSGDLTFESFIDPGVKPMIVRDFNDPNWLAIARPFDNIMNAPAAVFPSWMSE